MKNVALKTSDSNTSMSIGYIKEMVDVDKQAFEKFVLQCAVVFEQYSHLRDTPVSSSNGISLKMLEDFRNFIEKIYLQVKGMRT